MTPGSAATKKWLDSHPEYKPVIAARNASYREANRELLRAKSLIYDAANRTRKRARNRAYHVANPGRGRAWVINNPEKRAEICRRYEAANREKRSEYQKRHSKSNAGAKNARTAKRRAMKLQATPLWAEPELIELIYAEAAYRGMQVDHIIPLQGKNVCGLHIHNNMQLLTRSQNAKKSNRYAAGA